MPNFEVRVTRRVKDLIHGYITVKAATRDAAIKKAAKLCQDGSVLEMTDWTYVDMIDGDPPKVDEDHVEDMEA